MTSSFYFQNLQVVRTALTVLRINQPQPCYDRSAVKTTLELRLFKSIQWRFSLGSDTGPKRPSFEFSHVRSTSSRPDKSLTQPSESVTEAQSSSTQPAMVPLRTNCSGGLRRRWAPTTVSLGGVPSQDAPLVPLQEMKASWHGGGCRPASD